MREEVSPEVGAFHRRALRVDLPSIVFRRGSGDGGDRAVGPIIVSDRMHSCDSAGEMIKVNNAYVCVINL